MKKYASATVSALLLFGAVAAGLIGVPQNAVAQAAVTIETSADTFFGPGFVRVLITNPSLDDSDSTITPTVEARDGNTVLGSDNPTIEAIGSSGTFEFFITTSEFPLVPANPTKTTAAGGVAGAGAGPFVVRANTIAADDLDEAAAGTTVNGDPGAAASSNTSGLDADPANIDNFRVIYGGQTLVINFEDSTAELTADRTEAGDDNEIVLTMNDQDANLDPTLIDEFEDDGLATSLASTNTLDITSDPTWRETGQNTGVFELAVPITVNGAANFVTATLPTGNSFTVTDHEVHEDLNTLFTITAAQAPFDAVVETDDTDSVSVTLRNRDGAVALETDATLASGLMPEITDADRNIGTEDEDDISNTGAAALGADTNINDSITDATITGTIIYIDFNGDGTVNPSAGEAAFFSFTESDDSTGMFAPDYNNEMITVGIGAAGALNGAAGTITLTPAMIADEEDIILLYKDPAFQSNGTFELITNVQTTMGQLSANNTTVQITDDALITLTDPDLNTDSDTIETYNVAASTNPGDFEINGEVVGTLVISTSGEDDILGVGGVAATFIETGADTGVFVTDDIDVGDIDDAADGTDDGSGGNLDDGEEINFEYTDVLDDDDHDIDITVGIPDAGIDVDRNTVPVPTSAAGQEVTIVLSVVDPTANTNSGSVETITIPVGDMATRDGQGTTATGATGAGITTIGELTGITADFTLQETGPNTGIFEDDVDLAPTIADLDRLIDTRVTFEYDDETVSVTYRAFDGTITVDPSVAGPGSIVNVSVVDSDGNRDPGEEDELEVTFETNEDTEDAGQSPITLTETGPNTGVFTEEVELGVDIDISDGEEFSTEITFTYTDAITSAGDTDEDRDATVRIATSTGQLVVEPEVIGPGTEITLTLLDADLNTNPNGVDDTAADAVELRSSDGADADIAFEETGPNTGIFEATIQFEPRVAGANGAATAGAGTDDVTYTVLPGDVLAFRYEDEANTGGSSTVVSLTFQIVSTDPQMTTTQQTVQIGGTIALTIMDADADRDADSLDSVDVEITSDTDPVGFTLAALETGSSTGNFTVNVPTSQTLSSGSITVATGDNVYMEYEDEFPADYADRVETVLDPSKDFVFIVPVGNRAANVNATTPEAPVLKDISGNEISEVTVGQQVILSSDIHNNSDFPTPFAGIVEVRDADGFTVYLQWQTGTLNPNDTVNIGLSFVPDAPGDYTVRVFVLSSIENPAILSPVQESTFTVS